MSFEDELEKWIVTYLVINPDWSISPSVIIDNAPRTFVNQINSDQELYSFLAGMESKGLVRREFFYSFKLTTQGKLYFRKFIEPIFLIAKDKKRYSTIIEQTEGKPETKKTFIKILDSIKDKLPDDAEIILEQALIKASVEAIFYLIRLVVTAQSAS